MVLAYVRGGAEREKLLAQVRKLEAAGVEAEDMVKIKTLLRK